MCAWLSELQRNTRTRIKANFDEGAAVAGVKQHQHLVRGTHNDIDVGPEHM